MVRPESGQLLSEMVVQALSDESVKIAQPLDDTGIKILEARIDRLVDEGRLQISSDLSTKPRMLIEMLRQNNLENTAQTHIRKTLRRFTEILINLSEEPEVRILN